MLKLKFLGYAFGLLTLASSAQADTLLQLQSGWTIQSSRVLAVSGDKISSKGFKPTGWYQTTVPSTVLAALVRNKVYDDPYVGDNFKKIPGMVFDQGAEMSDKPFPPDNPFGCSWWFRNEFQLDGAAPDDHFTIHFDGINYMANLWINGKRIADQTQVAGTFRRYDFDITPYVNRGGTNVVSVEVSAAPPHTLGWTWVDWNPTPPDKDMGIWREVWITHSGPIAIDYPKVITHFDLPSLEIAHLTVAASLTNTTDKTVKTVLKGVITSGVEFSRSVELKAHETGEILFEPAQFNQLNVVHPHLWWPYQMGAQDMYKLDLTAEVDGKSSDIYDLDFGIRQSTSEMIDGKYRLFKFNGKPILIRGGGWANDLMFETSPKREEQEIQYVKDMHLNTVRFEGPVASQHLMELCDRYGILMMPGWECCCHWERWKDWKAEDYPIAYASLKSVLRRFINHPGTYVWLNGSDIIPPDTVMSEYLRIEKEEHWPNPTVGSASAGTYQKAEKNVAGPTGVKMSGPYQYVPPSYWTTDTKNGGGFGYNTETSVGPSMLPIESLRKMLPAGHQKLGDELLAYHCARGSFSDLKIFDKGFESRFGKPKDLADYAKKGQLMAYDGHRAMFEGYQKNKYKNATGVIQWMLNNSWPSLYWHLYDHYLQPGGAYFGAKKGNELLHAQYSYDDNSVVVVNNLAVPVEKVKVKAKVYDLDMKEKFTREAFLDVAADSSTAVFTIPEIEGLSKTYFVRLELENADGKSLNNNFYCLSSRKEKLDWAKSDWNKTPVLEDADTTLLNELPTTKVTVKISNFFSAGKEQTTVSLKNTGKSLAFFLRLKLVRPTDKQEVLPILWEDNYISLLPGESRELKALCDIVQLNGTKPVVEVEGWNVKKTTAK